MLSLLFMGFALTMLISAFYDAATMTIPNWISGVVIVLFMIAAPLSGMGWSAIGLHVLVGFGALAITMAMFAFGWIGGGDAKLFAVTAMWMGWSGLLMFAVYTALAGGVLTLFLLLARQWPMPSHLQAWKWSARLLKEGGDVPYGIGICVGALLAFPETSLFLSANGLG